jgi:RNA polymerase sigma-70 factor (ECF subfamily)
MTTGTAHVIHADDKQLVRKMLAGDERAFRRFFDDYYPRLYRFALTRMSRREDMAEEIAQLTLSKALSALETYRGEAQLFTWLCAICRHEIATWARTRGRDVERVLSLEDFPEVLAVIESLTTHDEIERTETARLIQAVLDRLPPRYGDALEWKYIEGFSAQEIADRLNLGLEAANSLLARAKRAFKEAYAAVASASIASTTRDTL